MRTKYIHDHLEPIKHSASSVQDFLRSLMSKSPDTFVLTRENPLQYLTDVVKETVKFYREMSSIKKDTRTGRLRLNVMQRQAIGQQRKIRTEIHICKAFIVTRQRQLERCNAYLAELNLIYIDLESWLPTTQLELTDTMTTMHAGIESYCAAVDAFSNTVLGLETSLNSVDDLLDNILPTWDRQLSSVDLNSIKISAEITTWE